MERTPIAIVITDTHLAEDTIPINAKVYSQVLDFAEGLGVQIVIHGGDIYESRKGQPEVVLTAFKTILDSFKERGVKMVAIAGNHDKTDYTSESSFLVPSDDHEAFDLINPFGMIRIGDVNLILLPYYDEKLKYREMLEKTYQFIEPKCHNILITHVGINEAKTNGGRTLESTITADMFEQFDMVLVGHYHDRQFIGDKIFYMGAAYQANFGEDAEKGCVIIYDDGSIDLLNLDFPRFINHKVDVSEINEELIQAIKADPANHKLKISGKITKETEVLIAQLDEIGVMMETVTESFDPVRPQIKANLQLTDNDIVESYQEWSEPKKFDDAEYGLSLVLENTT